MKITSRDNPKLKNARKTRAGRVDDAIFIEGLRLSEECLHSSLVVLDCFYSESFCQNPRGAELISSFAKNDVGLYELSDSLIDSISDTKHSQGIVVIARKPYTGKELLENSIWEKPGRIPLFILFDKINNPSNFGAIFRTAEAAGVCGVIATKGSCDPFSAKSLRASMGAAFRLPVWQDCELLEAIVWAKDHEMSTICADIEGANNYFEIDWSKPRLLIFGSEAHGLTSDAKACIEESVTIPMENQVESLNLAVSAGIILFEANRQRKKTV